MSRMVKFGFSPTSSAWRRRIFAPMAWNVPSHGMPSATPISASMRSRISRAALLVKVTARISCGRARPEAMRWATRVVSTRVLPVPAPASTSTGPSSASTARRCSSLRPREIARRRGRRGARATARRPARRGGRRRGCGSTGADRTGRARGAWRIIGAGAPTARDEKPAARRRQFQWLIWIIAGVRIAANSPGRKNRIIGTVSVGGSGGRLLLRRIHALVAAFLAQHAQRRAQRRAVALGLDQHRGQRADRLPARCGR